MTVILPNYDELLSVLSDDIDERGIATYLRNNPFLAYGTFCPLGGHCRYVLVEFPLGSEYRVDLLILNSHSGAWEAHFVELEPIGDPVFNKMRTPSKRLALATRQVDDWRSYVDQNLDQVRRDLVRWAKGKDLLKLSSRREPSNYSGDLLADPDTVIFFNYHVIIGRSSTLSKQARTLIGRYRPNHNIQVVTYDRFLDTARKMNSVR